MKHVYRYYKMIKYLIVHGEDINKENGYKRTSMWYARNIGNENIYLSMMQIFVKKIIMWMQIIIYLIISLKMEMQSKNIYMEN